jgi:hydrogenase maturation protein HypF
VQISGGKTRVLRRSRGYAPEPFFADVPVEGILAFGAEKTAAFALGRDQSVLMSQHLGDLQNWETCQFYEESLARFQRLFRFTPRRLVCDLHPDYLSTRAAEKMAAEKKLPLLRVQHHHAHAAACMLEHRLDKPLIAVVWDATGLGDDGTVWGGEFFLCDRACYTRLAHIENVPMPGGDQTALEPWRMAVAWLRRCQLPIPKNFTDRIGPKKIAALTALLDAGINCPLTSSAGRLFDALASLVGICDVATRQAEAPVLLEQHATRDYAGYYHCAAETNGSSAGASSIPMRPLIEGVLTDQRHDVPTPVIAVKIHETLARLIVEKIVYLQGQTRVDAALVSGGCFQNKLLAERVMALCAEREITLYIPELLPCNDSGVAAGQLAIAAATE